MGKGRGEIRSAAAAELRGRAEERLKARAPEARPTPPEQETQRLLHELQVHQIELEMQNAELRQARGEVEDALAKYTGLYDFAPVGYFTLGRNGRVSAVNLSGAGLLGVERSRLLGRSFNRLVAAPDQPVFTAFLEKAFASHGKETCEVALTPAGNAAPLFVHIEAIAFASGQECRVAVTDITARKRAEEALRESEEFNRRTLQALPAHLAVIDRRGRIIAVNHAWTEFARNNGAEGSLEVAVGADYCEVCRRAAADEDADAAQALAGIEAVLSGTNEQFTMEYPCHGPQQQRWFTMTVVPLGGSGGGTLVVHFNITARKQAEERVREYCERLSTVNEELSRFNRASVGRELRMIELKKEINELCVQAGGPPRYPLDFQQE